jgi:hypothetical protein
MGDATNRGITLPMTWLIGNASHDHVLFLEKDFQLVESGDCAIQQIVAGINMLKVGGIRKSVAYQVSCRLATRRPVS